MTVNASASARLETMEREGFVGLVGKGLEGLAASSKTPVFAAAIALNLSEVIANQFDTARTRIDRAEHDMERRFGPLPEGFQTAGFEPVGDTGSVRRLEGGADPLD